MRHSLPYARPGQIIGLLGGSFDPAHEGHAHITREALKRFALDRVWWLVSPDNPLKSHGPAALPARMARARAIMRHPRVTITDVEAQLGTRYTAETLTALHGLYPGTRFVWLMGADNLVQFHRWQDWQSILATTPVGVLARPGQRLPARLSRAARIAQGAGLPERLAPLLGRIAPPVWCFIDMPMVDASSSRIRARGDWHP